MASCGRIRLVGLALLTGLPLAAVAQTAAPDSSRAILTAVIARRQSTLARIGRSRYDAFIKTAAVDLAAPPDSASSVLLLTETELSAYWAFPDRFQETIEARHRPSDGGIGRSPAVAEEIEHFQRDYVVISDAADPGAGGTRVPRLVAGGRQISGYRLPLPVAPDALKHYDVTAVDTLTISGRTVLRLTVRARGHAPLFDGTVDVRDSSYDVVGMDLWASDAVRFPGVDSLRYRQVFADTGDGQWPQEVILSGHLQRRISARWLPRSVVGMPLPEFPRSVHFDEVATLSGYRSAPSLEPPDLPEYRRISRINALHSDTGEVWSAGDAPSLSPAEQAAWADQDSLELHPPLVPRVLRDAQVVGDAAFGQGFGHYNRVDGLYLGVSHDWRPGDRLLFTTRLGYALGREDWQYRAGARAVLVPSHQLWIGATYHDESSGWPSLVPTSYDAASAFVNRVDPNEYYRDHGLTLSAGVRILPFTRLELRYDDSHQSTLDTLSNVGFRPTRFPPLPNPPIADGHLRLVGGTLSFDSRPLTRTRLGEGAMSTDSWTRVSFSVDVSAREVLGSDFSFRRYSVHLEHQQRWGPAGVTTLTAVGGISTGYTPPQQYFTVGYGIQVLAAEGSAFNTLSRSEFAGTRAAMLLVRHDFGRLLFAGSGLPILRSFPATFSLHGGVFWTRLASRLPAPADTMLFTATRPYTEAGFTFANLTPFLSPFDFAISCTWQLSRYPTNGFRFGLGFSGL
jgi:hypothetical protein